MAKKVKRKVSQVVTPAPSPEVMEVKTVQTEVAEAPAARSVYRVRSTGAYEFNPDYTYVKKELKRIGILASTFFVVLIVLSFIIR